MMQPMNGTDREIDARRTVLVVAVLTMVTALLALVVPLLWPGGPVGEVGTERAGPLAGDAAEASDADELRVHVRTPARLVLDHASPFTVEVVAPGGVPLPADHRLAVSLDLDLEDEAAGWVVVTPPRLLTTAGELDGHRVELLGFGELPCGDQVGTLRVGARELAGQGRVGAVTVAVPGAACDGDVPDTPEGVHHDRPVRLEDWQRRGDDALRAPPPRRAAPAPSSPPSGGGGPPPAPPDDADEDADAEEPADENGEEPDPEPEPEPEPEPDPEPEPPAENGSGDGGSGDSGSGNGNGNGGSGDGNGGSGDDGASGGSSTGDGPEPDDGG